MHAPSRKVILSSKGTYFPFGRSQSRNLLEDFHPESYPSDVAGAYTDPPSNPQQFLVLPPRGDGSGPQVQMVDLAATGEPLPPGIEAPIASTNSSQISPASRSSNKWVSQAKTKAMVEATLVKRPRVPDFSDDERSSKKSPRLARIHPSSTADHSPPPKKPAPSSDQQSSNSILLLRCSDLFEIMSTLFDARFGEKKELLDFYINNECPLNGARNVLILKIILHHDFSCQDEDDVQYLWDVWFNLSWDEDTTTRFRKDLLELINFPGDQVYHNIKWSGTASSSFRNVWNDWMKSIDGPLSDSDVRIKIHKNRKYDICRGWGSLFNVGFNPELDGNAGILEKKSVKVIRKMVDDISLRIIRAGEVDPCIHESSTFHCCSSWIMEGHINSPDYNKAESCLNPTMLEQGGDEWIVHPKVNPLTGFLPIVENENVEADNVIVENQFQFVARKILVELVGTVRRREEQVLFHFFNEHPLELCFTDTVPPCHVIHGYDLADQEALTEQVGLANLLMAARRKLVPRLSSILQTHFSQLKSSDDSKFFLKTLGFPVTMLPTIFGLELATAVQVSRPSQPDRTFSWRWAPAFFNVRLDPNSTQVNGCIGLSSFKQMCFSSIGAVNSPYTPQSFNYVLTGLARRSNNPSWSNFDSSFFNALPIFKLVWRTLDDWYKGQPVFECRIESNEYVGDPAYMQKKCAVRLVLSLSSTFSAQDANWFEKQNTHCFSNIELCIEGVNLKSVSFLLTKDHGLKHKTLYGHLVDAIEGTRIAALGQLFPLSLNKIALEHYSKKHPYSRDFDPPVPQVPPHMMAACLETEEELKLDIPFEYYAFSLKPVLEIPCEITNEMTLKDVRSQEVTLTLPHSIVHDSATMRPQIEQRHLVLKKYLNFA